MGVDNSAVARRYLGELFTRCNVDAIDELADDEITLRDPMTPDGVRGKAELRKRIEEMPKLFADSTTTIRELVASGDRVIACTTWRGRHIGEFFGIKPTNRVICCECVEVLRIKQGKVIENVSYFDVYGMFQQMGAVPPIDHVTEQGTHTEDQQTSQTATA